MLSAQSLNIYYEMLEPLSLTLETQRGVDQGTWRGGREATVIYNKYDGYNLNI